MYVRNISAGKSKKIKNNNLQMNHLVNLSIKLGHFIGGRVICTGEAVEKIIDYGMGEVT